MNIGRAFMTVAGICTLSLLGSMPILSPAGGGQAMKEQGSSREGMTVKGELLRIDKDMYVVKDRSGKEVRLHVDRSTDISGTLNPGDTVEAKVTEEGHALSIKQAHKDAQPDAGMGR